MKKVISYIIVLLFVIFYVDSYAQKESVKEKKQPKQMTRILFVFDASNSMSGRWQSDTKISIAKKLLSNLLDSLKNVPNLQLALRVYGHQKDFIPIQDCDDTRLEVPFALNNSSRIKHKLQLIEPKGTTPIAKSLEQAANDFPACDTCRNIIILITDGIEECNGDPCAASHALQKKGIALKPFIIGIGKNFAEQFKCVGTYFDATQEESFRTALNVVISQALNSTTAQVNLLDINGNPTETNVNMTFYDNLSGKIKYNFIHTLNTKGVPDTLVIDPLLTYNIVVHTIPEVEKDSIKLTPGKHTVIAVNAPQGYLKLKVDTRSGNTKNLPVIVRKQGTMETLNTQYFNQMEKYLVGKYDMEVLCLPRLYISNVEVSQNKTTSVEIPAPGIAVIQKSTDGYGSIYVEKDNKLEWVYNLKESNLNESVILQPGFYRIFFRSKYLSKSIYTIEKCFKVNVDSSVSIILQGN